MPPSDVLLPRHGQLHATTAVVVVVVVAGVSLILMLVMLTLSRPSLPSKHGVVSAAANHTGVPIL